MRIGLHRKTSRLPIGRAHLAVLVDKLEGLNQADDFVDIAADGKVIDSAVTNDTSRGNDEQCPERDT